MTCIPPQKRADGPRLCARRTSRSALECQVALKSFPHAPGSQAAATGLGGTVALQLHLFATTLAFLLLFPPFARATLVPGEITLGEMNCLACHEAAPAVAERLASRQSPCLGQNGARLSPRWMRDFLLNPQIENPGAQMPDMLHALPVAEKVEAAESLTHYLVSLQGTETQTVAVYDAALAFNGRDLYHEIGCVACH